MRISGIAAAGALLLANPFVQPVQAATTTAASTLPLRITVAGKSINRADTVTVMLPILATGATDVEARAARDKRVEAITKALVAAGIDRSSIRLMPPSVQMGFIGNELLLPERESGGAEEALATGKPFQHESALLRVEVNDSGLVSRIKEALTSVGFTPIPMPRFTLRNDGPAHKVAIADALATARREADTYAEALGMRVGRMVGVSNAGELSPTGIDTIEQMTVYRILSGMDDGDPASITTTVRVWVDFELAQR